MRMGRLLAWHEAGDEVEVRIELHPVTEADPEHGDRGRTGLSMPEAVMVLAILAAIVAGAVGLGRSHLGGQRLDEVREDMRLVLSEARRVGERTGSYAAFGEAVGLSARTAGRGADLLLRMGRIPVRAGEPSDPGDPPSQLRIGGRLPVMLTAGTGCTRALCTTDDLLASNQVLLVAVGHRAEPVDTAEACTLLAGWTSPALVAVAIGRPGPAWTGAAFASTTFMAGQARAAATTGRGPRMLWVRGTTSVQTTGTLEERAEQTGQIQAACAAHAEGFDGGSTVHLAFRGLGL